MSKTQWRAKWAAASDMLQDHKTELEQLERKSQAVTNRKKDPATQLALSDLNALLDKYGVATLDQLEHAYNTAAKESCIVHEALDTLRASNTALAHRLDDATRTCTSLEAESSSLSEWDHKLAELDTTIACQRSKVQAASERRAALQETNEQLQHTITTKLTASTHKETEAAADRLKIEQSIQKMQTTTESIKFLQSNYLQLNAESIELNSELASAQCRRAALEEKYHQMASTYEAQIRQLETAKFSTMSTNEDQLKTLRRHYYELEGKTAASMAMLQQLVAETSNLQINAEKSALEAAKSIEQAMYRNAALHTEMCTLGSQIQGESVRHDTLAATKQNLFQRHQHACMQSTQARERLQVCNQQHAAEQHELEEQLTAQTVYYNSLEKSAALLRANIAECRVTQQATEAESLVIENENAADVRGLATQKAVDAAVEQQYSTEIADLNAKVELGRPCLDKLAAQKSHNNELRLKLAAIEETDKQKMTVIATLKSALEQRNATVRSQCLRLQTYSDLSVLENDHNIKNEQLRQSLKHMDSVYAASMQDLEDEKQQRLKMQELIFDIKHTVRVFCRIRPLQSQDSVRSNSIKLDKYDSSIEISALQKSHHFNFDHIFTAQESNSEVFDEAAMLIESIFTGSNVAVIAYGQPGTGKTFTMMGNDGLATRSLDFICRRLYATKPKGLTIRAGFHEIYNHRLRDLTGIASEQGLHECRDGQEMFTILRRGLENYSKGIIDDTYRPSRSHAIFTVYVEYCQPNGQTVGGKLSLYDLAANDVELAPNTQYYKEAQEIDQGIGVLHDVFSALNEGTKPVFSATPLTSLLESSLTGSNTKCLLITCLSPSVTGLSDTLADLKFASLVSATRIS